jgi:chromosome segregation ATPase
MSQDHDHDHYVAKLDYDADQRTHSRESDDLERRVRTVEGLTDKLLELVTNLQKGIELLEENLKVHQAAIEQLTVRVNTGPSGHEGRQVYHG